MARLIIIVIIIIIIKIIWLSNLVLVKQVSYFTANARRELYKINLHQLNRNVTLRNVM